jgi:hypothetical protein
MKDPSRANDGERHVPTAVSEDSGALGEAAMAGATGCRHGASRAGCRLLCIRQSYCCYHSKSIYVAHAKDDG